MSSRVFYSIGLILLLQPSSAIQGWSAPFRVSPYSSDDISATVCVDGGRRLWITWFNPYRLYSRTYFDGVWSEPMLVDSTKTTYGAVVRSSAMCRDALGQVWVTWIDSTGCIRLSYFDSQKWAWSTTAPDSRITGAAPGITSDAVNNIWCSWTGFTTLVDSNFYIMAGCYDGYGWTRFDTLAVLPPYITYQTTGITTDNISGNIWICWNGGPLNISGDLGVYAEYFDGINWSVPESIGVCDDMAFPTVSADSSGNIWVAWYYDFGDMDGKLYVRYAGGDTWSEIQFPHSDTSYAPWPHPDICSDSQGRIWLGWAEARRPSWDTVRVCGVYYKDEVWKDLTIIDSIASPHGDLVDPVITCGSERVWLTWYSAKEGDSNIYVSYTSATGIKGQEEGKNEEVRLDVYPNPFSRGTVIVCQTDARCASSLKIYDLSGRLIKSFIVHHQSPTTKIFWDGRDEKGEKVQNGVYFARLQIGEEVKTRKLVRVK